MIAPTYTQEFKLLPDYKFIAGVDEVGRGPLAGPVVSAAVILDPHKIGTSRSKSKWWAGVRDSKILSPRKRGSMAEFIKENCLDFAIGQASHREIDELNIHYASLLSMKRALENLKIAPDMVLIDGLFKIPYSKFSMQTFVDGDARVLSIAAASILAKVYRDNLMKNFDGQYREFGFTKHKGYNTAFHRKAIFSFGPCPIHRMTFPALQSIINKRFARLIERQ